MPSLEPPAGQCRPKLCRASEGLNHLKPLKPGEADVAPTADRCGTPDEQKRVREHFNAKVYVAGRCRPPLSAS